MSPAIKALVQDSNQFGVDLYHQFNLSGNTNAFFSPYTVFTGLGMTMSGAGNQTAAQMAKVLHLANPATGAYPATFANLQKSLNQTQSRCGANLYLANSLWPQQNPDHALLPAFVNSAQGNFDSVVFAVDFKNHADDTAARINSWVADTTLDKVKGTVRPDDLDANTGMLMVTGAYFKGAWSDAFESRDNLDEKFHLADGTSEPAVLMHQTLYAGGYAEFNDGPAPFQILSLNYFGTPESNAMSARGERRVYRSPYSPDGRLFSFIVILPRLASGLPTLEKSLTADNLTVWLAKLAPFTRVEVFLPKFKLNERYSLSDTLKAMGMTDAFSRTAADFSGVDGGSGLHLGQAIHSTSLDVDENGTGATTASLMGAIAAAGAGGGPPPPLPHVFRADHPFLFLIRDNTTGSILFIGRLASLNE